MDIRQYDLWVDGDRMPTSMLEDFETQLEVSTLITFNDGRMTNDDASVSLVATHGSSFASMRNTSIEFVLRNFGPRPAVTIFSRSRDLRWESPREGIRPGRFGAGVAWPLEWGRTYTFYQNFGRADQRIMRLKVVRCRIPLAPRDANVSGRALRERFDVEDTADNAENVY